MARPTNEELAEKQKSMFDKLQESVQALADKVSGLESENESLKRQIPASKGKKFKVVGAGNSIASDWKEELEARNRQADEHPEPTILVKEAGFKGLEDACPYCNDRQVRNLIDINPRNGCYQCRACGKSWVKKMLNLPYHSRMETGQYDPAIMNEYARSCEEVAAAR